MPHKTLTQIISEKPFPDYAIWWPMGPEFSSFMAQAIVSQWAALPHNTGDLAQVQAHLAEYLAATSGRVARAALVDEFVRGQFSLPLQSGEFDALSYAFFRAAFELIEGHPTAYRQPLEAETPSARTQARERRLFTRRVGQAFFDQLHQHLKLGLPGNLKGEEEFNQLQGAIASVGAFLQQQGYLRDHFAFHFEVTTEYAGRQIRQTRVDFLAHLQRDGLAHALYEMGYPAILPSAVYLFHTIGEAQHHSSRIIEELFARTGYEARETDDFDPTGYPSDRVVELWEIRPSAIGQN